MLYNIHVRVDHGSLMGVRATTNHCFLSRRSYRVGEEIFVENLNRFAEVYCVNNAGLNNAKTQTRPFLQTRNGETL